MEKMPLRVLNAQGPSAAYCAQLAPWSVDNTGMRRGRIVLGLAATAGALVCITGSASGATRYAAATGSNKRAAEPCLKRAPCGLRRAIENGRRIDKVVVASGAYAVSREIAAPAGLDVRAAGRSRPRLAGNTARGGC